VGLLEPRKLDLDSLDPLRESFLPVANHVACLNFLSRGRTFRIQASLPTDGGSLTGLTNDRSASEEALAAYLERVPKLARRSRPSVFWKRQLEGVELPGGDARIPDHLDYGFQPLLPDSADTRGDKDPDLRRALESARTIRGARKQLQTTLRAVDKATLEHSQALDFLRGEGLLTEYLADTASLGVRSTMSTARHWWYARSWRMLVEASVGFGPNIVLEIGAGAGNFACFAIRGGHVCTYTIIDLPQMLAYAGFTLTRYARSFELCFEEDAVDVILRGQTNVVALLTPERATDLPDEAFDAAVNFNSFMEMDRDQRDQYFDLIYRVVRSRGLFYNVNRRQQLPLRDGSSWDNNPLLYPYRPDDHVLLWEADRFQTVTRAKHGSMPSLAVARAAVINP
jgi:hypothetical protein